MLTKFGKAAAATLFGGRQAAATLFGGRQAASAEIVNCVPPHPAAVLLSQAVTAT